MRALINYRGRLPLILIVFSSVLLPRLMLLGGYPATDDGFYTYWAMTIFNSIKAGEGLPYHGMLLLYPTLLSWTFLLEINHFFALRFVDMLVTCISALLLYRLLVQESGSRIAGALLASAFMFTLNAYPFIQHGFRNSQFAAYIPLLIALSIAVHKRDHAPRDWFLCGVLVALCVLLRENFVYFAIYGTLCLFAWKGWRPTFRFILGGIIAATIIMGVILALRGGMGGFIYTYSEMGFINSGSFIANLARFSRNLETSIDVVFSALSLTGILFLSALWLKRKSITSSDFWRVAFWMGLTLIPLTEPFLKKGIPYHYSVCLIGLSGLAAFLYKTLRDISPLRARIVGVLAAIPFCILSFKEAQDLLPLFKERTIPNLMHWQTNNWSPEAISNSRYLAIAETIKQAMPANGGHLSVSGGLYGLFALTEFSPPSYSLQNMTLAYAYLGKEEFLHQMQDCPPDVIFLTGNSTKENSVGHIIVTELNYSLFLRIEKDNNIDYGQFSGGIYKLNSSAKPQCKLIF